ncbi:MAG: SBBP repeat-containing protein [Myxococcota bacterium]
MSQVRSWVLVIGWVFGSTAAAETLTFSTYLGGAGTDQLRDITVDAQGNVYLAGGTQSSDFPTTAGAYSRASNGSWDAFVVKLSPQGALLWSTYVGGPNYDRAYAIEVDSSGAILIAGRAGSGFPTTAGVVQPSFVGDLAVNPAYGPQDGFVAKLSADGATLLWATYVGNDDRSFIRDIDIDASGHVLAVLTDVSRPFPHVTAGSAIPNLQGGTDGAVVKLRSDGQQVLWGTYLGGAGDEAGGPSLRVERVTGSVYVVGNTSSANFPTPNGFDTTLGGGTDAFLAKLSADGASLLFATYLGGSAAEGTGTHNVALDPAGNVVVGHWSQSTDLAMTGHRKTAPAGVNSLLWKFSSAGQLLASTYVGGSGDDGIQGVATDTQGNVVVSLDGTTSLDLPVTAGAFQATNAGAPDGALIKLSPDLGELLYATFLGGRGSDGSRSTVVDSSDGYFFAGFSSSDDFPLASPTQSVRKGQDDLVIARFTLSPPGADAGVTDAGSSPGDGGPGDAGQAVQDAGGPLLQDAGATGAEDAGTSVGGTESPPGERAGAGCGCGAGGPLALLQLLWLLAAKGLMTRRPVHSSAGRRGLPHCECSR